MTPADMIANATEEGLVLQLTTKGTVAAKGDPEIVARWTPILRLRKDEIIAALQLDLDMVQRTAKVLAMLKANKNSSHAVEVFDDMEDSVIVTIAIRDIASCELKISRSRYEPFKLLELIENRTPVIDLAKPAPG